MFNFSFYLIIVKFKLLINFHLLIFLIFLNFHFFQFFLI